MKILIVEDEKLAIEHLEILLHRYDSSIEIIGKAASITAATAWFEQNSAPDLAFFDIQLTDGLSFEIVEKIEVPCPIIFATAFDEYTLKAFKVNSIDYLLKPYDLEDVSKAIEKYKKLKSSFEATQNSQTDAIQLALQMLNKSYKTRFLIKSGARMTSIQAADIAFLFHENKLVWAKTQDGKKHVIDYTLDQLEQLLDPKQFFRINRKYIIAYEGIQQVTNFTNSRLKVRLLQQGKEEDDVVVSRERVSAFKAWLDG